MPADKICKTVRQQNREPVPKADLEKLLEIARDYCDVKNYVYQRYGGIKSLSKLYPGYTVQNEMTGSGLRERLNMPSVYFYLAVFDALGEIKSQWSRTKTKILRLVNQNERFSEQDKHYIRFLFKVRNAFGQILNEEPVSLKKELQNQYEGLSVLVDRDALDRYVRRQVRRYHVKPHTDYAMGFSVSERAYRYGDHGIYISVKEKRKRVFIPLTDNNQYKRQLYVKLYPDRNSLEIHVPIYVSIHSHPDYDRQVGLAFGMFTMLTTDEGHCYGEQLGAYQQAYAEWMYTQALNYWKNQKMNPGRKKYSAKKRRFEERMHSYINHELNRFLNTERPDTVYMPKLPRPKTGGVNKKINYSVSIWQRGYIRRRMEQKCREESVAVIEVFGKSISTQCSQCGMEGTKKDGMFTCPHCQAVIEERTNAARNAKKRGQGDNALCMQKDQLSKDR